MNPNYDELSFACCMGPELRKEVERQLTNDLKEYVSLSSNVRFDWSTCCVEGTRIRYLDGEVEDFSSIRVFDLNDQFIGEGWMNFIYEKDENIFIVYWDLLDLVLNGVIARTKRQFGIPNHVINILPSHIKDKFSNW